MRGFLAIAVSVKNEVMVSIKGESLFLKEWRIYRCKWLGPILEIAGSRRSVYRRDDKWEIEDASLQRQRSGPHPGPRQVHSQAERDHSGCPRRIAAGGCRPDLDGHGQSDAVGRGRIRFHHSAGSDHAGKFPVGADAAVDDRAAIAD